MKNSTLHSTILLLALMLTFVSTNGQGWKNFRKTLKKEFTGMTPYSIPDINYSPGAVLLILKKNEQLYSLRSTNFPNLNLQPFSPVPSTKIVKVKNISFDANAESQIIPNDLSAVARLGIDSKSTFHFEMKRAEKHQIEISTLEILIENLNISNTREKLLLEKLIDEQYVVVVQALLVDGMTFSFKRQNKFESNVRADLENAASKAKIKLNITSDYDFTLESDTALYYAFDIYHKNTDQLKQLYEDKKRIAELEKKKSANTALISISMENEQRQKSLRIEIDVLQSDLNNYKSKINEADNYKELYSKSIISKYKDEIARIEDKLKLTNESLKKVLFELQRKGQLEDENIELTKQIHELLLNNYQIFTREIDPNELDRIYGNEFLSTDNEE